MCYVVWLCLNTTLLSHFISAERLVSGFLLPRSTSLQRYKISQTMEVDPVGQVISNTITGSYPMPGTSPSSIWQGAEGYRPSG